MKTILASLIAIAAVSTAASAHGHGHHGHHHFHVKKFFYEPVYKCHYHYKHGYPVRVCHQVYH